MNACLKIALAALSSIALSQPTSSAPAYAGDQNALTAVTHGLCPRSLVMLGESATHGDGHTEAFKVALVERLVDECGFDTVLFEANHYEFIPIARQLRAHKAVTVDQLSSAIGGLWKFDREFQPLVPFLLAKAQAGQIALGGVDDQLGQLGQDYANGEMVTELTGFLPQQERQSCSLALHRRIYSDYTAAAPYSPADRSQITACLSEIERVVTADMTTDPTGREERREMTFAVQRWIARDFTADAEQIVGRDRSMFRNFTWLRQQTPRRRKVILWAATVHIAKQGDPTWADHTGTNFGSFVHQEYGTQSFSLGFSALTGSYRQSRRDIHEVPVPPQTSLEAQASQGVSSDTVYLGPSRLTALGIVPGAIFRHSYQTLPWADFLDGVVVFHEEWPPVSTR